MASNQRQGRDRPAGPQRLALLAFGGLLILLFIGFAVAQGIGHPSVPSDAVAVVEDAPDDTGTVTKKKFERALAQTAATQQIEPVPKPGDERYEEVKEAALAETLQGIWILGQGEEMGISPTPKAVAKELKKLKAQAFQTPKQYREYLKQGKLTRAEVRERVKIQMVGTQIQEQAAAEAPTPSRDEIKNYYEAAKSSTYTTPESRDVRLVRNKDEAKVEEAKAALDEDDSVKSWEKVAKKYSTDTTKGNGGLQSGVTEESGALSEPLQEAVFAAPQGEVQAVLKDGKSYVVFEVMKITPEKVQSLEETEAQITSQLTEQAQRQSFNAFLRSFGGRWSSRTFCASGFTTELCANFKGDGRPAEANPACFEADPETPAEACPAIVPQVKPAQPGTVSLLSPEGQKLAQRPRPSGAAAPAAAPTELPPGVVPEEGN